MSRRARDPRGRRQARHAPSDDGSEDHIPSLPDPPGHPRSNAIRSAALQLLNALQTAEEVDLTTFRETYSMDRRVLADILSVFSALPLVRLRPSQTARLCADERLTVPVNLAHINDEIQRLSDTLRHISRHRPDTSHF